LRYINAELKKKKKSYVSSLTILLLGLIFPRVVHAQDNSTGDDGGDNNQASSQFLQNAVQRLQWNGLTALAGAAAALNSPDIGSLCGGGFSEQLAQSNITIFAPSNEACKYSLFLVYSSAIICSSSL
jgi:hypothetical protein